ncbi:MAG: endonuclease/exonuclease/phosphatase family protein [Candidatus Eremiobacterota bacterium]
MKFFGKVLKTTVYFYSSAVLLFILLCSLDHLGLFSSSSIFFGLDCFQAPWLLIFIIPALCACLILKNKKLSIVIFTVYIIFFLFYGDISIARHHTAEKDSKKISVLALNVQYYHRGLDKVIKKIKDLNADITLLSENVLKEKELKYMTGELKPWYFFAGKPEETAIISKYPFIDCKEVEFPSFQASLWGGNTVESIKNNRHRSFVHCVINLHGKRLNIISVRFIAGRAAGNSAGEQIKWGQYILKTQMEEVEFFREYISKIDGPVVFGGDLNGPPGSKLIKELNKFAIDSYMAQNLYGKATFNTEFPFLRLDYIFCINLLPVKSDVLPDIVSDHFPLYSEFLIE